MTAHRTFIRRLCFALITARTLAFAVAPFIDLQVLPLGGEQSSVQAAKDPDSTSLPQHDPATCAICALLHDTPWPPAATPATHTEVVVVGGVFELASAATLSAPRQGFLSRAPPTFG